MRAPDDGAPLVPTNLKVFLLFLAVTACTATAETAIEPLTPGGVQSATEDGEEVGAPIPEQCDADTYRPLIGQPLTDAAIVTGPRLRAFGRKDIITQEYIPQRTNIVTSETGEIIRVYCG